MNCQEAQRLLHAAVDGELDLVSTLDFERHIQQCTECAAIQRGVVALRTSISGRSLYHRAPASLEAKIRQRIRRERRPDPAGPRLLGWKWPSAAAALVAVAALLAVVLHKPEIGANDQLAAEISSAHIRSLMAEHLWDVKSTDQHTVKPWFDGKIDFAPDVRDFKNEGFALEGGRLDYVGGRSVVALVYRHEKHEINLFVWPAPGRSDEAPAVTSRQGYVMIHWVKAGMNHWAVSDMNEESLKRFAGLVQHEP
jgi:anti-sigma factor RsiW